MSANIEQATKGIVPEPQNGSHNFNSWDFLALEMRPDRYNIDAVNDYRIGAHPIYFFHPCL